MPAAAPATPTPLFNLPEQALPALHARGYAVIDAAGLSALTHAALADLAALSPDWAGLPPDEHLKDGGRYRKRRHACFTVADTVRAVPHRAHWQPVEYNALHGGMSRWFEPMLPASTANAAWRQLLQGLGALFDGAAPQGGAPWFVEAHQFRIDTEGGIGRPTPEGAHRDGVDFVVVVLIDRQGIKGGETRVFEADGPNGQRFTLSEPWSALLLDDRRVIHESTPIQPLDVNGGGHRDTLVLTYRRGGFQGDPAG